MQLSTQLCRNALVLAIGGFAIAATVDLPTGKERYSPWTVRAIAAEPPIKIAQTTANGLLVEIDRLLDEGWHQMKSGQYQSAIASYESAITYAQNIGAQQQEAEALMGIGVVDARLGNHQQAIAARGQAFSIYQSLGQLSGAASALENMGDSYWAIGNYSQAESHFREAIDLYRQTGDTASEQYVRGLLDQVIAGY